MNIFYVQSPCDLWDVIGTEELLAIHTNSNLEFWRRWDFRRVWKMAIMRVSRRTDFHTTSVVLRSTNFSSVWSSVLIQTVYFSVLFVLETVRDDSFNMRKFSVEWSSLAFGVLDEEMEMVIDSFSGVWDSDSWRCPYRTVSWGATEELQANSSCYLSLQQPFYCSLDQDSYRGGLSFEMRLTSEIPDYFSIKDCFIQDPLPTSPMFRKTSFFPLNTLSC